MDERLEKALDFSNFMVTLHNQLRIFKEQYYQNLICYYSGGQFTVTQELITFCNMMSTRGYKEIILIDDNENPIEIENLEDFLTQILDLYFRASNSYLNDYNKIKKERSVKNLVDL